MVGGTVGSLVVVAVFLDGAVVGLCSSRVDHGADAHTLLHPTLGADGDGVIGATVCISGCTAGDANGNSARRAVC